MVNSSSQVGWFESALRRRQKASGKERGAILVEMALVLPFLVMLAFGLVETGMGWRNAITVTSAARQGARVSSHLGQDAKSDQEGLLAVIAVMGSDIDQVEFVVFYNANGAGDVPAGCLTGSQAGICNHYDTAMIADAGNDGPWGCDAGDYDEPWCPGLRDNDTRTADHLGVYISFKHEYFTGVIPGDPPVIKRQTIMRIEPEAN